MKEVFPQNMVAGTEYYIERRVCSGNGKQKGIFQRIRQISSDSVEWCVFTNISDVVGISGYGVGDMCEFYCDTKFTKFYLPEREQLITNAVLQNIIGDSYFTFYDTPSPHSIMPPTPPAKSF